MFSELKRQHLIIFAVMLAVLFGAGVKYGRYLEVQEMPQVSVVSAGESQGGEGTEETAQYVTVHVAGAVIDSGVFTLIEGSRVIDAVEKARPLPEADLDALNLAKKLTDQERVIVTMRLAEVPAGAPSAYVPAASGYSAAVQTGAGTGLININSAGETELVSLPGIGPAKAKAIIQYREENGPFSCIEDLDKVSGIGPATLNNLKDLIIF